MDAIDPAATAWLLASTALVLLMTPGLAIFYGGMVRTNGVLNIIMVRCECAYSFTVSDAPLWPINEAMTAAFAGMLPVSPHPAVDRGPRRLLLADRTHAGRRASVVSDRAARGRRHAPTST